MPDVYPNEPVPYEEHARIVADLQSRLDAWAERYTELDEYMRVLRQRAVDVTGAVQVLKPYLSTLNQQIERLETQLRAGFPD